MAGVREFFQTGKGQITVGVFVLLAVAGAAYTLFTGSTPSEVSDANHRTFIDSENMKGFEVDLAKASIPAVSPFTGKKTGYPAELCYWTKDGKPKATPTPVLLNGAVGVKGPTFCPDCGRLVVQFNPKPTATSKPPPTRDEFATSGRHEDDSQPQ